MEFTPARLALARRRRGLSQRELAKLLECDERTVRKWESGDRVPDAANLSQLASVLRFAASFFGAPEFDSLPVETVSFRALSKTKAAARNRAIAGGELALDLSEWLDRKFSLPVPDLPDLRHYHTDPEAAAMALRTYWRLGDLSIKSMIELLEAKGVRVYSLAEDCLDLDAYSFWRDGTPFIFLNTLKSSERSRFDAAHELAHLVLHKHGEPTGRVEEREADGFAGAFLMPRSSVLTYGPRIATIPALVQAKHHWNVSVGALAHRVYEVGLITEWQYRSLCIEIQKTGLRKTEPQSRPRETSQIFQKVFSALREQGIGKPELAAQLGWHLDELNALVFGLVLSPVQGGRGRGSDGSSAAGRDHLQVLK
jgi:Zn-dependent peptidase ImmA (M78 family)/DNA-binding XRE family transcriptional regulator